MDRRLGIASLCTIDAHAVAVVPLEVALAVFMDQITVVIVSVSVRYTSVCDRGKAVGAGHEVEIAVEGARRRLVMQVGHIPCGVIGIRLLIRAGLSCIVTTRSITPRGI